MIWTSDVMKIHLLFNEHRTIDITQ